MSNLHLDPEEQALLESVENGEWQPVPQMAEAMQRYQKYATAVVSGEQEVTIHLSPHDWQLLQAKANEAGVPYETLIVRLVQDFVHS